MLVMLVTPAVRVVEVAAVALTEQVQTLLLRLLTLVQTI
jgi:hypothetical protein